jgi:large conductance mechanosensitive channel
MIKFINKLKANAEKEQAQAAPVTKTCPKCCSEININATKCPFCTSDV